MRTYIDTLCGGNRQTVARNSAGPEIAKPGGEAPTIDDPLYRSIADELRAQTDDLAAAMPEDTPWEFTVPTTLVWLQEGPELPVFPA